jgi:hypothetical protein
MGIKTNMYKYIHRYKMATIVLLHISCHLNVVICQCMTLIMFSKKGVVYTKLDIYIILKVCNIY